jgi:hypothetical protein
MKIKFVKAYEKSIYLKLYGECAPIEGDKNLRYTL